MFEQNIFIDELKSLPVSHGIAFAASCCERLLPLYDAFHSMEKWGNPSTLRKALDLAWSSVYENYDKEVLLQYISQCYEVTPDADDFSSIFLSGAERSASAICYTLDYCIKGDSSLIALVGQLSLEAVEMYLNIVNDPDLTYHLADPNFDAWIGNAPLIKAELRKQKEDLALLKRTSILENSVIEKLQLSSLSEGINPKKRGLI